MSPNRRIILNITATYGRSLFAMLCGIFTSRWVLMSLGQEGFGLYGLIAGLTMFITFINGTLATAVARYYTVTIGAMTVVQDSQKGLEECRRWFSLAVFLHTILSSILVVVGYPIGVWAIENWLNIPPNRVEACVWVLRYVTFSSFVAMVNVPYTAMYTAKQYIAELTIYSLFSTIANVLFVSYMATHEGDWLERYALAMCLTATIPQLLICIRASRVFNECRFNLRYCFDLSRIKQLCLFAIWQMFGTVAMLIRCEALSIITNKAYDARYNSSMSIATIVNSQSGTLSAAMYGAFSPVIMTAYGEGNYEKARLFAQRACKFAVWFFVLFAIPLLLEMDYVLKLWLVNPPPYCTSVCALVLIGTIFEQSVCGTNALVNASGRIRNFQIASGIALLLTIPIALFLIWIWKSFLSIPVTIIVVSIILACVKLLFARILAGFSLREWWQKTMIPLLIIISSGLMVGTIVLNVMQQGFYRLMLTTASVLCAILVLSWYVLLSREEKGFLMAKIKFYYSQCQS